MAERIEVQFGVETAGDSMKIRRGPKERLMAFVFVKRQLNAHFVNSIFREVTVTSSPVSGVLVMEKCFAIFDLVNYRDDACQKLRNYIWISQSCEQNTDDRFFLKHDVLDCGKMVLRFFTLMLCTVATFSGTTRRCTTTASVRKLSRQDRSDTRVLDGSWRLSAM